jgi:hypothetical protein
MHPVMLRHVAQDHVRSLIEAADAARLARAAAPSRPSPGLRRRLGLRLIAAGQRLAPSAVEPSALGGTVQPGNVVRIHGGRV